MAIGVSYTGHDGRHESFSVQGAENAAARMSGLAGRSMQESMNDTQGLLRAARKAGAQRPQQAQPPSTREKVMFGGSVVRGADGALCLRGEETTPLVPGTKLFAANNGMKGFFSLDEIDPPVRGAVVGKDVGDSSQSLDPSDARKDLPNGVAWAMRVQTDERAEKDAATGLITVYKYFRRLYFSAAGRSVGCSGEWREVMLAFLPGTGGGSGKYGVKLFSTGTPGDSVHPIPNAFAFGAEEDLDTWNEEGSRFDCNYDDSGNVLSSPPVKVIAVATCPGGEPGGGG